MRFPKSILILFLIAGGFFILPKISSAQIKQVVINEVFYNPTGTDTGLEWIELYNPNSTPVNLTGWDIDPSDAAYYTLPDFSLAAGAYVVIHVNAVGQNTTADLYAGLSSNMGNTKGPVALFNNSEKHITENLIDYMEYGAGGQTNESKAVSANLWTAGEYVPNVTEGKSLSYKGSGSGVSSWQETDPTPGTINSQSAPPPPPPPPGEPEEITPPAAPAKPYFLPREVLINEIVSDPNDEDTEWVELINNSGKEINLSEWIMEEGSGATTNLSGSLDTVGDKRFAVIKNPKGNLDNKGDIIILRYGELIIDQVTYGNWDDSYVGDNAPIARDPYSLIRKQDAFDTNNDNLDWTITATLTKGKPNILTEPEQTAKSPYANQIIINELLPDPLGNEASEFIELKNISDRLIDLTGWQISDNGSKKYTINSQNFPTTQIPSSGFFVLTRNKTGLALNNTGGETVELFGPDEQIVASVKYGGAVPKNQSYSRSAAGQWIWTMTITAGQENIITTPNEPPQAVINAPEEVLVGEIINFDGSDSFDPNHEPIKYNWNFGDQSANSDQTNPIYLYLAAGNYQVALTATDAQGASDMAETKIKVVKEKTAEQIKQEEKSAGANGVGDCPGIIINEFMPNPASSDDAEWIELYNPKEETIDLDGWILDDSEGGSRGYQISGQTLINGNEYLVFDKEETGLALNNTIDSVRLINPTGAICSQIDYDSVIEGASYNRGENNNWFWSMTTTPDGSNSASQPIIKKIAAKTTTAGKTKSGSLSAVTVDLEKIREYDVGDKVTVKGLVAVEPKILGKTIFYLAGSGIQIYSYKQDFPDLKLGDYVQISGILSESGGETRIKTATKNDITILEHREPPQPHELEIANLNEDTEGWLATIEGEITEIHSANVYVDDGTEEAKVYIKETTGIDVKNLSEGQRVKITGIVSQTSSGYRLLPRYPSDIEVLTGGEAMTGTNQNKGLAGYRGQLINYLAAAAVALMIIIIGLLIKNKKQAAKVQTSIF